MSFVVGVLILILIVIGLGIGAWQFMAPTRPLVIRRSLHGSEQLQWLICPGQWHRSAVQKLRRTGTERTQVAHAMFWEVRHGFPQQNPVHWRVEVRRFSSPSSSETRTGVGRYHARSYNIDKESSDYISITRGYSEPLETIAQK
ncbi:hypothetical protein F4678DRAFT_430006 [Xylaria arbuscula]|nr:hypothetical protein F4678DRAFT_430006 [Xylaria arbuscula]